jgi:uncharacterized glyoxalase superfamily protein PhnB
MKANRTMPPASIIPELGYDDVGEAIDWLCAAFGFRVRWRAGDHRAQLSYGNGTIAVTESRYVAPGRSVLVRVDDVGAHHAQAAAHGARILAEPADYFYGERQYSAEDVGGNSWTFSESIADVVPEDWGGTSVDLG